MFKVERVSKGLMQIKVNALTFWCLVLFVSMLTACNYKMAEVDASSEASSDSETDNYIYTTDGMIPPVDTSSLPGDLFGDDDTETGDTDTVNAGDSDTNDLASEETDTEELATMDSESEDSDTLDAIDSPDSGKDSETESLTDMALDSDAIVVVPDTSADTASDSGALVSTDGFDIDSDTTAGQHGGSCLPDNTCSESLACENGICFKTGTFISTWRIEDGDDDDDADAGRVKLPLVSSGTYNFVADWGDGTSGAVTSWDDEAATHFYAAPGEYEVRIRGVISGWQFLQRTDFCPK